MFSDSEALAVGFAPNREQSRTSEDSSVQTSEAIASDKDVQAKDSDTIGIQTEDQVESTASGPCNEEALAAFLGRICPAVVEELDRISRSNAFASYNLFDQDSVAEVRQLATLPQSTHLKQGGGKVSALSWSCTGSVVAVAVSHTLHSSWCSHPSQVALYNVDRDSKKASRVLEVPSCVRSVSMHPYLSSVLAAGLFSGEVIVWDTAQDNSDCGLVNVAHSSHNDSVTQVCWTLSTGTAVTLVSSALDGQLFFWKVSPKLMSYQVQDRYAFDVSSVPPGITCFAFPRHTQDTLVVALEGGALHHCSTSAAKPIATGPGRDIVKDPTVAMFEPQPASIVCIEFSPHHEDLFATASTDQAIRVYSLFQRSVQQVVWAAAAASGSLAGVSWSPAWPHVLAAWGHSGPTVTLYDSQSGAADSLATFLPDSSDSKVPLSAVAFNTKSPKLVAVGDLEGTVHVWEIPLRLSAKPKHL